LLPTSTMMTSLPRSLRTSSIHRTVFKKLCRSAYIEKPQSAQIRDPSRYCRCIYYLYIYIFHAYIKHEAWESWASMSWRNAHLRRHRRRLQLTNPWCRRVWDSWSAPVPLCPWSPHARVLSAQYLHGISKLWWGWFTIKARAHISLGFYFQYCHNSHQSCNRTVRSSRYIVFDRKSMPMVACREKPAHVSYWHWTKWPFPCLRLINAQRIISWTEFQYVPPNLISCPTKCAHFSWNCQCW